MSPAPTAADRRRDLIAIALVIGGAVLFVIGFLKLRELHTQPIVLPPGGRAYPIFLRYYLLSVLGLVLAFAGIGTAVWAFLRHERSAADAGRPDAPQ